MTPEDYVMLKVAMSCFVICGDCRFYKAGICTLLNRTQSETDGMLICSEEDGCTFGVIKESENNDS